MPTGKAFVPYAQKYRRPKVTGNFSDIIQASDGTTTERVITAVEFCDRYGIHLNTLKWHVYKKRLVIFKGRYKRWLVDMENSTIPEFSRDRREDLHSGLNSHLREPDIKTGIDKDRFLMTIDGKNYAFGGSKLVYEAIGPYLGIKPWDGVFYERYRLPPGKVAKLVCRLENGKRHYFSCHPDYLAEALEVLIGKPIGDSKITGVWFGSKGKMV